MNVPKVKVFATGHLAYLSLPSGSSALDVQQLPCPSFMLLELNAPFLAL